MIHEISLTEDEKFDIIYIENKGKLLYGEAQGQSSVCKISKISI